MGRISVIIVCHNRVAELRDCLGSVLRQTLTPDEIIVVDNSSTDGTGALFAAGGEFVHPGVTYLRSETNLGVAGGRNLGIRRATGDLLLFIDDDAMLVPVDAIARVDRRFGEDGGIGVLAFKVIDHASRTIRRDEFPHADKALDSDTEFETTYFIGAGHAIRKQVFALCGLYPDDYFYGMEELDLSFRALDRGFRIVFFPGAVVWHKRSPRGRVAHELKWVHCYRNRLAVAYKYLRPRHLVVTAIVWFAAAVRHTGSIAVPLKGLGAFLEFRKGLCRHSISAGTIRRAALLGGRIWY